MRLEGSNSSKFVQLVRDFGYNKDIDIELATVTAPPPNLKIKIDGMSVELEKSDLIVAERLAKHTRNTSGGGIVTFIDELKPGDRVIVASINNGQAFVVLDKAVIY